MDGRTSVKLDHTLFLLSGGNQFTTGRYEFKLYFCGNWPPPYSYVENIPDPKLNARENFFLFLPQP